MQTRGQAATRGQEQQQLSRRRHCRAGGRGDGRNGGGPRPCRSPAAHPPGRRFSSLCGPSSTNGQRNPHLDRRPEPSSTRRAAGTLIYGWAAEPSSTDRQQNPHLWTGSGTLIHQMGGWNPHLRTGGRNPGPRPGGRSPIYRTAGWPEEADEGSTSRGLHGLRLSPEPLCARHTALSEAGTRLLCRGAPRVRGHTEGPLRVSGSGAVAAAREPAVEPQRCAPDGLCRDGDTSEGHPGSRRSRQPTLRLCSQTALTLTPRAPHSRAVWGC